MCECESEFSFKITYNSDNVEKHGITMDQYESEMWKQIAELITKKFPEVYYWEIQS